MSNQGQKKTSEQNKKKQQVNKPDSTTQVNKPDSTTEQIGEQASLIGLSSSLVGSRGDSTIQAQAAQLGDTRFQTAQRQMMARQIGQIGGNLYLQRVVAKVNQGQQTPSIQGDVIQREGIKDDIRQAFNRNKSKSRIKTLIANASLGEKQQILDDGTLMGRLTDLFSASDMRDLMVTLGAPLALNKRLNAAMDGWGTDSTAILRLTANATATHKQEVLADEALITRLQSELNRSNLLKVLQNLDASTETMMLIYLKGNQKWKNPRANDFFVYFVTDNENGTLPDTATMNCWESIMYAAYLAGKIDGNYIRNFYSLAYSTTGEPNDMVWATLGASKTLPKYPDNAPQSGQLLFYYGYQERTPSHVALSLGGDDALSLWWKPADAVQHIKISDIYGYVYFTDPPW